MKQTSNVAKVKNGSKVLPCSCHHDYQDRVYGYHKRVHSIANKSYRCTVCGIQKGL